VVILPDSWKLVDAIEGLEIPSLIDCERLEIRGPVIFEPGVRISGRVTIEAADGAVKTVAAGSYADQVL